MSGEFSSLSAVIENDVAKALAEDVGSGDLTAQLIPADKRAGATVISRVPAVICGAAWFNACFRKLDPQVYIQWSGSGGDGNLVQPDQQLCTLSGNARALLTGERVALNFLQTLSAVATATHRYVEAIKGTRAQIVDTRKTLPGLRIAEKYAVRVGGGTNHRIGLFDGILIKENHIAATGGVEAAFKEAQRNAPPGTWIQIEVENLEQLRIGLAAGAKMILLDNMNPDQLREAVKLTAGRAQLEASGGVTLENVRAVAETGVDRISIGSLTKDIQAIDLSMRFTSVR
jgi:nicotinate-nucleotide pyrophosphorylase (carboxylating)